MRKFRAIVLLVEKHPCVKRLIDYPVYVTHNERPCAVRSFRVNDVANPKPLFFHVHVYGEVILRYLKRYVDEVRR